MRTEVMPTKKYSGKLGTTDKQTPIAAKFPPFLDCKLREMKDRSNFIRKAVTAKMREDGLLNDEEIEQAIALGLL